MSRLQALRERTMKTMKGIELIEHKQSTNRPEGDCSMEESAKTETRHKSFTATTEINSIKETEIRFATKIESLESKEMTTIKSNLETSFNNMQDSVAPKSKNENDKVNQSSESIYNISNNEHKFISQSESSMKKLQALRERR